MQELSEGGILVYVGEDYDSPGEDVSSHSTTTTMTTTILTHNPHPRAT